ncbi:glycosyl hydrolase family 65 protein, partial [Methylobacterium tarhaniae]|uniref:glycosyl hydrolase family 65 protein n=1 Tax=Methylobacterium tarhaniae TaxID=1187852 RepID=UPI003D0148EF
MLPAALPGHRLQRRLFDETHHLDPCLPDAWSQLSFTLEVRSRRIRIDIDRATATKLCSTAGNWKSESLLDPSRQSSEKPAISCFITYQIDIIEVYNRLTPLIMQESNSSGGGPRLPRRGRRWISRRRRVPRGRIPRRWIPGRRLWRVPRRGLPRRRRTTGLGRGGPDSRPARSRIRAIRPLRLRISLRRIRVPPRLRGGCGGGRP